MDTVHLDKIKTELLTNKILDSLNLGSLALMLSVGHRTGLFDAMSQLAPATSDKIAEEAKLNERYVREWLGGMTVSGIVEYNPELKTYYLPPEHSTVLIRAAGADNIAVFAQYISMMGNVEDDIVECFKRGGGVPYSKFKRFHEIMAEDSGQSVVSSLLTHILPLIPGIKEKLEKGINVIDLGCGRGRALHLLAKTFPHSTFTGYDLSDEAIEYSSNKAAEDGLHNLKYEAKDLTDFNLTGKFDFVTTFDAVHDQARPDLLLKGIFKILKDDGVYLMQDISGSAYPHKNINHPMGIFLYTASTMHCMTVSLAQGGMGLGTFWGRETALKMLEEAGFKNIEIKNLPHDVQNDYYIITKY